MICKDCLSNTVCAMSPIRESYSNANIEDICEHFKNKADYIECANLLDGISSAEFGLDEIVDELIYKHNLDFLHDNDEDAVREFAKDLIDCIKNYIKTQ